MSIRVVIFDFDGTLADTRKTIVLAKQETMRFAGLEVKDEETCASTIGYSAREGFKKLYPDITDDVLDVLVPKYRSTFDELVQKMPPELFPGTRQVLDSLKEKGYVRTIATARNKTSLYEFLDGWGMTSEFSYILTGDDALPLKPNPDAVIKTLKDLSFQPEEALVVGDMPMDVLMGKNAGAFVCGVTYGNAKREELLESGADYVIDSICELPGVIEKIG